MWIEESKIHLDVYGEQNTDQTLLFIHGAGGGAALWREAATRLSGACRVAAIDLPGHGQSPAKDTPHSIDTYVQAVVAAIQALGDEPVTLCGHSMGGAVAMLTALNHTGSVRALILAHTGARLRVMPQIFDQLENDYENAVRFTARFAGSPNADPKAAETLTTVMMSTPAAITIQDFRICDNFDIIARLGGISCPTLIIGADKDQLTPLKYAAFLNQGIAGSGLAVIPECGHFGMLEAPALFAETIASYLKVI